MLRTPALIISVAALAAVAGCARQTPLAERLAEESRRDASPREKADVILVSHNEKKIQVIRVVREITGLGLEEAKALVESAPAPVKRGVYQDEAKQIRKKLEAVGATVEVRW